MASPFRSSVIDAPVGRVWALVGDFGGVTRWMPFVVRCEIEDDASSSEVGAVRRVEQNNDVNLRERLVALSETDHSYSYAFVEGNLPIRHYAATIRLFPITDEDRTYLHWSGEFDVDPKDAAEMMKLIESSWTTAINAAKAPVGAEGR